MRVLKKSELSDYTDYDTITQTRDELEIKKNPCKSSYPSPFFPLETVSQLDEGERILKTGTDSRVRKL